MANEQRYYDALKQITNYMTPDQLRRNSEKMYGLPYEEALEYAYENAINVARQAVKGKRRPTPQSEVRNEWNWNPKLGKSLTRRNW